MTFIMKIFASFFDMHSAVVNQGLETFCGEGKNHDDDRAVLHGYEKHGSNH